ESQDRAIKQMKSQSRETERRLSQEEDTENRNEKRQANETIDNPVSESDDSQIGEDDIEDNKERVETNKESEVTELNNQNEPEELEEYEEEAEIERLQNQLYNTIDNLVPTIYLDNFDIDLEFKNGGNENFTAFTELENLTINNVKKARTRTLERLQEERQSTV